MHAHFIVRDGLYVRAVAFPVFESGYHAITEDEAKALVGEGRDHQREHYSGLIAGRREVTTHGTAGGNELVFHAVPRDDMLSLRPKRASPKGGCVGP